MQSFLFMFILLFFVEIIILVYTLLIIYFILFENIEKEKKRNKTKLTDSLKTRPDSSK